MAAHEIEASFPAQVVVNKDVEVIVRSDGVLLGRLQASKGSLDWKPGNTPVRYRLTWERFDQFMREVGSKTR